MLTISVWVWAAANGCSLVLRCCWWSRIKRLDTVGQATGKSKPRFSLGRANYRSRCDVEEWATGRVIGQCDTNRLISPWTRWWTEMANSLLTLIFIHQLASTTAITCTSFFLFKRSIFSEVYSGLDRFPSLSKKFLWRFTGRMYFLIESNAK